MRNSLPITILEGLIWILGSIREKKLFIIQSMIEPAN